ncbi:MAG: hypothetical protein IPH75_03520 [bacterium]|nr:hypothetical protein [bacterium]
MKKLALAFVLLLALLAISYVTSLRSQAKLKQQYDQGFERGNQETVEATRRADSLRTAMEQSTSRYQESLKVVQAEYASETDSLQSIISDKDSTILALKQKAKVTKASASKPTTKPAASQASLNHTQILNYYKRRLGDLPKDLSEYERRVALTELRDETARKFAISLGELDKIRQNNSLKD